MKRTDYWRLTVHFYPHAAEQNVRPVRLPHGFGEGVPPGGYAPHDFDFRNPPSREDFLQVYNQLPWMNVWKDTLIPVIAANPWPMIDFAHKGAHAELMVDGKQVGHLEVWKQETWENGCYNAPFLTVDIIEKVTRRLKGDREAARKYIDDRANTIMEACTKREDGWDTEAVVKEVRKVLVEGGFLKGRKKVSAQNS